MRKIINILFVTVMLFLPGQQANGQMLAPAEITPQSFNNCVIFHLRRTDDLSGNGDLTNVCNSPKGWSPTLHSPIFIVPAVDALYTAEKAFCGAPGCASTGKDMRLVLVGDPLPNVYVPRSPDGSSLTIVITTTLVDLIQRNTHALINDFMEDPALAPEGFKAWIDSLRSLGGKSCRLPVQFNTRSLSPKISIDLLRKSTVLTYSIVFAHEIAHIRVGQSCGYQNNPTLTSTPNALAVEKACDRIGLEQLTKEGVGIPLFAAASFVGWEHYITLKLPQLEKDTPRFKELFPSLNFRERSRAMVDYWEKTCRGGFTGGMCLQYWSDLVGEARKIIDIPLPQACVLDGSNRDRSGSATNAPTPDPVSNYVTVRAPVEKPAQDQSSDNAEAKRCVKDVDTEVDWNKNGDPPVVRTMFEYENTCERSVKCKVVVESGHRPSTAAKEDYSEWKLTDILTFNFTLPHKDKKRLLGTLGWDRRANTTPGLRWPSPTLGRHTHMLDCSYAP
ncbi:MAG TPA: hypothetical protein VF435_13055 [Pyrinomonadaceae bacterium]